jgi:FkbM family methyltransferase
MDLQHLSQLGEYASVEYCISSLINNNKPIIFFEVGVFDGDMSGNFLSFIQKNNRVDNRYFAFEPDSRNYNKIINNPNFPISKSGVELVKKALHSKTGEFNLFTSSGKAEGNPNEYDCCSSLLEPNEVTKLYPFLKFDNEMVNCITIDDICKKRNIEHIDFIYADIQGAEVEMIKGAKEMMSKVKFMFLEKSDKHRLYGNQPLTDELINVMKENNFEVANNYDCDILFYNTKLI